MGKLLIGKLRRALETTFFIIFPLSDHISFTYTTGTIDVSSMIFDNMVGFEKRRETVEKKPDIFLSEPEIRAIPEDKEAGEERYSWSA